MPAPRPLFAPRRVPFEPRCTHLTMTRLFNSELICELCRRPGSAGWLYQCVQDQEDFIEHLGISGKLMRAGMDDLSLSFIAQMGVRKGTAAARDRPLSLLDELSPTQVAQYSSEQMGLLLKQRENVRLVIQGEIMRFNQAIMMKHLQHSQITQGYKLGDMRKPWDGGSYQECCYLVCSRCRPSSALRATLSLDAVANGEIPPTAAAGYGFHNTGGRPVADVEIVRNLGCRPVPLPTPAQSSTSKSNYDSRTSSISQMDLFATQTTSFATVSDETIETALDKAESSSSYSSTDSDEDSLFHWRPRPAERQAPPSPTRRPKPLRTEAAPLSGPAKLALSALTPPPTPSKMGPPLPNIEDVIGRGPAVVRRASVDDARRQGANVRADATFTPSPVKVGQGVAMLEESVQLGVPDVITQI